MQADGPSHSAPRVDSGLDSHQAPVFSPEPDRNLWRLETAERAAILIDGAAYFSAVREAFKNARSSIFIIGWDLDGRCKLVGDACKPGDGLPESFAELVSELARKRPELQVYILLWDFSLLYALERELIPSWRWRVPRNVTICLDSGLPLGSSHHQKIVVVDDKIAFSGGLDLTVHRWDTSEHKLNNPDRCTPDGKMYAPFHDVQALVDGDAARAISELARDRWQRASCQLAPIFPASADPWPKSLKPDIERVKVGIARTIPHIGDEAEVREVEALFHDTIASAEQAIYIENQFLTYAPLADDLAALLKRKPNVETIIVTPKEYGSWVEMHSMRNGRVRFRQTLERHGIADSVRLVYPHIVEGSETGHTMIHSKVCIIDDRLLRIGSANLNHRSMGTDTECDLLFIAESDEHRAGIRNVRARLLGEHIGRNADEAAALLIESGSLLAAADAPPQRGHSLQTIDDGPLDHDDMSRALEEVADPPRALPLHLTIARRGIRPDMIAKLIFVFTLMAALPFLWKFSPLAQFADEETTKRIFAAAKDSVWAPFLVVGIFVAGGLIAFPVVILIVVTAATFGPLLGVAYASAGCLASAVVLYFIGASLGQSFVESFLGPRLQRIRKRVVDRGILAVAIVRVLPVAPYSVINLVAGAIRLRLSHFVLGTILGMAPGLVLLSLVGHQVMQIIAEPTLGSVALLILAAVGWITVSIGVQMLASLLQRRGS